MAGKALPHNEILYRVAHMERKGLSNEKGDTLSLTISTADFKSILRKRKEHTSTSQPRRHLGHYTAILDEEDIVGYHCIICSLPLKYNFLLAPWCTAVKVMLKKDPRRHIIEMLRVIHILKADHNFVLKSI